MRIQISFEVDSADRLAIGRDVRGPAMTSSTLATRSEVENWIRQVVGDRLGDVSFNKVFCDAAQIDAFPPGE